MIFNIIKSQRISYILIISLFALASCSGGGKHAEEATALAESYPEYAEEAAAPTEIYSEYAEEAAAPAERYLVYARVAAYRAEIYSEYAEESAAHDSNSEYAEEAAILIPDLTFLTAITRRIDEYSVILGADKKIKIPGMPGELRVWIGSPSYTPYFPERMIKDKTTVPAVGESAKVQPFAPAFKIDPPETQCLRIHPSGSEVRFKLIPNKKGTFEVGADVYLYNSTDCSGAPIPKTASTLKVLVEVDQKEILIRKVNELLSVSWEKFMEFWAALVAIVLGLILFLIRGKLKKWLGYGNE